MPPIVIIGAGMAAYSLAREFRKLDKSTPVMLVTSDAGGAYAKPMLSNAFALGKQAPQLLSATAEQMAATLGLTVLAGTRVSAIDRDTRHIVTDKGRFAYAKLVLALGADPIRLPLGGDAACEVLSVNHLDDYAQLRQRLALAGPNAHVAIIGAGLIGCEFADDLVAGGHRVTLVDPNPRPLAALAAPVLSDALARAWAPHPITLKLGAVAASVDRSGDKLALTLSDASTVEADVVLSAIGLRPSIALAQQARLATGRGIVVDGYGQTSAPGIYALGDCAEYTTDGTSGVMPYVAPMLAAARAIAATLAGAPTPIALKPEAVIVKTASCKLALLPPAPGTRGEWRSEADGERTVARFVDDAGVVRGFGLTHHTPALRQGLLAELGS
ncbi:MAG: NAD(P)/FAD-dependent oxidoreductase [Massilia sp.]